MSLKFEVALAQVRKRLQDVVCDDAGTYTPELTEKEQNALYRLCIQISDALRENKE